MSTHRQWWTGDGWLLKEFTEQEPTGSYWTCTHKPAREAAVSGKKKHRWIDSLVIPFKYGRTSEIRRCLALRTLTDALYWAEAGNPARMHKDLTLAGGHIVEWRRSLEADGNISHRRELAHEGAVSDRYWIASCIRLLADLNVDATDLRWVEAVLRTIWKEQQ